MIMVSKWGGAINLDIDDLSISCGICANAFLCRAPVVVVGGD